MGQKAITVTLRKHDERLDRGSLNPKELVNSLLFNELLRRSFEKKGVFITYNNFNLVKNTSFLTMHLFYRTKKLLKLKKIRSRFVYIKNLKDRKLKAKNNNIIATLLKNTFKTETAIVKTSLINLHLKKEPLFHIYNKVKQFKRSLFARRYTFFMDFIKLTRLFTIKKINVEAYLSSLATIFKGLHKRAHGAFFIFLRIMLHRITKDENSRVLGAKVIVSGKLKGKDRAKWQTTIVGKIASQIISADVHFSKTHLYTLYGSYGIKFWVNYKQ